MLHLIQPKSEANNRASSLSHLDKTHPLLLLISLSSSYRLYFITKYKLKQEFDILVFSEFSISYLAGMIDSAWKLLVIIFSALASPLVLFFIYQQTFRYMRRKRELELGRIWRMTHDELEEEGVVDQ